ncbi:Anti-anti-sigma regulatory factor (antagonist of anti-sigma factor) [Nannocystis exedens]|uniref:Anti-anti-sigma regulatory factor (Antagonist of anti-sigma factor) n=1 Tax=Nannocystis exedens TaxID=54 RepID=A0A1I1YS42_9BACT|nr:STAS domain-containing protein [Nannocystis exedens]PCC70171.1 RsbT co-antagonist protein RsbRA [Nannocystis exedens]SFE22414.1 Anti-anti-sigma regulatory factor (antagonist of anti-sigma factor) [Nannocystis exedens]
MSVELPHELEALRAEVAALRQEKEATARKATRAMASFQQHALAMEVIRQKNEELDRLTAELEQARAAEVDRARALELGNEKLRRSEAENHQLIVRLRDLVAQLSTPILRVWPGVLALPIVGAVDEERAAAITSRTLAEVTATRARFVILDVTGVATSDARTAAHVVALARATRLLGARCIVCGLQPAVAGAMATLGLETALAATRDMSAALAEILRAPPASRSQ